MPLLTEKAPAKINLTLRVVARRADGYHELESLVAFADLADELSLEPGQETAQTTSLQIGGAFASTCGPVADNLVLKAAGALGLPAGRFILKKNIPVAAGLGGGSTDAAAALRLIARANGIAIDDPRIAETARETGADVLVCLERHARTMRGIGEQLSPPVALSRFPAVLVNPGVPLTTREVFAGFRLDDRSAPAIDSIPADVARLIPWLTTQSNDLTRAAVSLVPAIADVLSVLATLPGCRVARMSGSGPTCYGLFNDGASASAAAEQLSKAHGNWWICPSTIG